jgi:polyketide synthase PksN
VDLRDIALDQLLPASQVPLPLQQLQPAAVQQELQYNSGTAAAQPIAIIGMAGQVGSQADLTAFWQLLATGCSDIGQLSLLRQQQLADYLRLNAAAGWYQQQDYFQAAFLPRIDEFDFAFFGLSRQEACLMDPQQRLLLQHCYHALEDAGYAGSAIRGSQTGVYIGASHDFGEDYRALIDTLQPDAAEIAITGNIRSVMAGRISYLLDLTGPALVVDTACSSALVAVHLACRALAQGDCQQALAAAVNVNLVPLPMKAETGIGARDIADNLAADWQTKAFDARSDGMSIGEGVFALMLKPLSRALQDGDQIHAVIQASCVNQDGRSMGLTAPSSSAQAALLQAAWQAARIDPADLTYLEAHGTGTRLGDPVELSAIRQAFSRHTTRRQFCALGSVKTNVGHLDNAAGMAGLVKVLLALKQQQIPPSLHFQTPNPQLAFEQSPVYLNDRLRPWQVSPDQIRLAGVSSFGLSGTNCHLVIAEAPAQEATAAAAELPLLYLLPLSARSPAALHTLAERYLRVCQQQPALSAADLCFTASTGRAHFNQRLAVWGRDTAALAAALQHFLTEQSGSYQCGAFQLISDDEADTALPTESASSFALWRVTASLQRHYSTEARQLSSQLGSTVQAAAAGTIIRALADCYLHGADLPVPSYQGKRVSLPGYPYEMQSCWLKPSAAAEQLALHRGGYQPGHGGAAPQRHPLLDHIVISRELWLGRKTLHSTRDWMLAEHKIAGVAVLPGTCYVEMMLELACRYYRQSQPALLFQHIQFLQPLVLAGTSTAELHLQWQPQADGFRISLCSLAADEQWQEHASATGQPLRHQPPPQLPAELQLAKLQQRCSQQIAFEVQEDVSRGLAISARWYGSFVAGFTDATASGYLFQFSFAAAYRDDLSQYRYHPALLDTAINAANHLVGQGDLYLPFFYQELQIWQNLPQDCWFYLQPEGDRQAEVVCFSVLMFTATGQLCGRVGRYGIKKAGQFGALPLLNRQPQPQFYQLDLRPAPSAISPVAVAEQSVLLIGEDAATVALQQALQQAGARVSIQSAAHLLSADSAAWADAEFGLLIYTAAWSLSSPEQAPAALLALQQLLQHCIRQKITAKSGMVICTGLATAADPLQAALALYTQVAAAENPQLQLKNLQIDLSEAPAAVLTAVSQLWQHSPAQDAASSFIWQQGGWHRECISAYQAARSEHTLVLRPGGSYLITGGCGGLGLALAEKLTQLAAAQQVQIQLILTGTTPLPAHDDNTAMTTATDAVSLRQQQLRRLQTAEVTVEYQAVDVADPIAMAALLHRIRQQSVAGLSGVIHAAGRAGDGFLLHKDDRTTLAVMTPKMLGAYWLDQLTTADELDFFVLYSSIASWFVQAGQSDYTAANRFMDALALQRRERGFTALSICWPAWRETGIAKAYGAVSEEELFLPLLTEDALERLLTLLSDPAAPAVVLAADLNLSRPQTDMTQSALLFEPALLRKLQQSSVTAQGGSAVVSLLGIAQPDAFDLAVAEVWAQVLGVSELAADEHFNDLGGNSILVTQQYKAFAARFPGALDMADLFSSATVRQQAALLRQHQASLAATTASSRTSPAASQLVAADLATQLARLAAGEISLEQAQQLI